MGEERGGDREPVGDDVPGVDDAVPVGVVEAHDPVVPRAVVGQDELVGIVEALGDEQPAVPVEGHRQRLGSHHRLGGHQIDVEALRHERVLQRFTGLERCLHLLLRLELRPPFRARGVVGGHLRRQEREGLEPFGERFHRRMVDVGGRHRRIAPRGPADAALHEDLEAGMPPGALVVPPGGVEDAPLPLGAHPGPRLVVIPFHALLENGAATGVVARVDVGLVPTGESGETGHDRMVGDEDRGAELAGAVALELGPHHVHPGGGVAEAVTRAVERHEPLSAADVLDERALGLRGELVDVGVDGQRVVGGEGRPVQVGDVLRPHQIDAAVGEHRLELGEAVGGAVVSAVAQEEDAERRVGSRGRGGGGTGDGEGQQESDETEAAGGSGAGHGRFSRERAARRRTDHDTPAGPRPGDRVAARCQRPTGGR